MEDYMAKLEKIEGIGPAYAEKLRAAKVRSTDSLLNLGSTKKGRKQLAEESGISESLILEWTNHADLFRVKGVGSEYADLLEEAGVDTVPELANRNPGNLHAKMVNVNEDKELCRQLPSKTQVEGWVAQAKTLPRVISH
jgi:predicted flap endonuclease-1-like 5' DNA nuclease